jgi:hypothetical protein
MNPVAYIYERQNGSAKLVWVREPHDKDIIKEVPLYTAPRELSDELPSPVLQEYFEKGYKCAMESLQLSDEEILDALQDALNGWTYIRQCHGDLYGVGWDRVQDKLETILKKASEK